jgi:hypothetical protein
MGKRYLSGGRSGRRKWPQGVNSVCFGWFLVARGNGKARADKEEVVAVLRWPRGLKRLSKLYTLEYFGAGSERRFRERWKTAVVVTAARLYALKISGRPDSRSISVGKFRWLKTGSRGRIGVFVRY